MKAPLIIYIVLLAASACAPRKFYYPPYAPPDITMICEMLRQAGFKHEQLDSVKVFEATLREDVITMNSVGEITVLNDASKATRFPVPASENTYRLFLFMPYGKGLNNSCIFLTTVFRGKCAGNGIFCRNISVGPAYAGTIFANQIHFTEALKMNKCQTRYKPLKSHPADMRLITPKPVENWMQVGINVKTITIHRPNKISGNKPLQYDIENIFRDDKALLFTYRYSITN